jgi:hypothetical protein
MPMPFHCARAQQLSDRLGRCVQFGRARQSTSHPSLATLRNFSSRISHGTVQIQSALSSWRYTLPHSGSTAASRSECACRTCNSLSCTLRSLTPFLLCPFQAKLPDSTLRCAAARALLEALQERAVRGVSSVSDLSEPSDSHSHPPPPLDSAVQPQLVNALMHLLHVEGEDDSVRILSLRSISVLLENPSLLDGRVGVIIKKMKQLRVYDKDEMRCMNIDQVLG